MFKNRPPICDNFGKPYICWDKLWSISSTGKFMISCKSKKKMLSIDISHIYGGYVGTEKRQAQVWANLEANLCRLMVSILHWGVIFQIHHMIEKIWWWGMITNRLKSPTNLHLEVKNQKMARCGGYIYNITSYI